MASAAQSPIDPRLATLQAGEPLEFALPSEGKEETQAEREARAIPAKWLEELAVRPARIVNIPIRISGAIIAGDIDLKYATFEAELSLVDSEFTGAVGFSFATFKRSASFRGSRFGKVANFRGAHAGADFEIVRASFADGTSFQDLHVDEVLNARGASFASVSFERIEVAKSALFRPDAKDERVQFGGEAIFRSARFGGNAQFDGAEFKGGANFNAIQVEASAFFRSAKGRHVQFGGEAVFRRAHIHGQASFLGAEFKGRANFDALQVDGNSLFRRDRSGNRVTFGGPAIFRAAVLGAEAQFTSAVFNAPANFENAYFKGAAIFDSVEFAPGSDTTFIGARFERGAYFNSAQLGGKTNFTAAVVDRDAQFIGAHLAGPASFREARFQAVFFAQPSQERREVSEPTFFGGSLDLRGFTYERIYVPLTDLFPKLTPFDRQPYSQLESALRRVGDDQRAHQVYLERRRVERREKFRPGTIHLWALDWLFKLGANYGVRPYRLIGYALVLIFLGAVLFSQPGALEPKKDSSAQAPAKIDPAGASFWKGLEISVHYFLPMDTPLGADLVPTATRVPIGLRVGNWSRSYRSWLSPSWYATIFLRVAGSVLVGIGLAAVTGLLRRIAP